MTLVIELPVIAGEGTHIQEVSVKTLARADEDSAD